MSPGQRHLDRRMLLRGTGGIAIALPFFEMMRPAPARAQGAFLGIDGHPKRILFVRPEQGCHESIFWPTGGSPHPSGGVTNFAMGPVLAPLERHKADMLVIKGLDIKAAYGSPGNNHCNARTCVLTSSTAILTDALSGDTTSPTISFDQALANKIGTSTRFKSLEIGVDPAHAGRYMSFSGPRQPVPSEPDAAKLFDRIFRDFVGGGATPPDNTELLRLRADRKSVLDAVTANFTLLRGGLGRADRDRLDEHAAKIRDLEMQIEMPAAQIPTVSCVKPARPIVTLSETKGANNTLAWMKAMHDLIVLAFTCDLTRIISYVFVMDSYPFAPINRTDSFHDNGAHAQNVPYLQLVKNWFAGQMATLVDSLKAIKEGPNGTSLMDNTMLIWFDEFMNGGSHYVSNVPVVIIGSGGGTIKTNRFLTFANGNNSGGGGSPPGDVRARSFGDLWIGIQNALGIPGSFGEAKYTTGPLPNLT